MLKRRSVVLTAPVVLAALACFALSVNAETPPANIGKHIENFQLLDTRGKLVSLAQYKDKKAVAVIFIGMECPINNAYMPRLAELHKKYDPKGVQFLAINSNCLDKREDIATHARKYGIPFPVLKDEGNRVADRFGARRTPEAFLLDQLRIIRYQGRIDDQFGIGYKRSRPRQRDLAEAIEAVLAGKPVRRPVEPVAGCMIARVTVHDAAGPITYSKQVVRILQKNCQECHRPAGIGPMPLMTFADVTAWAETIREVIKDRRMPPWGADPRYGKFFNDRRLSAADKKTLLSWLDHGTSKGDDKDLPPPLHFVPGWTIGKPDLVLTMPKAFEVPADMPKYGVPYQYFSVETGFQEDRWVARAEAKAGASSVVHHIVVFILPPGQPFFPGNPETPVLCGTAPGDMPTILEEGTAKKVPAGSRLVFQMHYTPNGKAQKDRSSVGIIFAKKRPKHAVFTEPIANLGIRIPAGADNYRADSWFTFEGDGHVTAFMPHMHLRGKDFRFEAIYPDGKRQILLSVPHFDFNWQSAYRLAKPLPMPKGTRIHCIAHWDNSAKNPNNPDPTKTIRWGDQTWEEMMIGWLDYYYDRQKP